MRWARGSGSLLTRPAVWSLAVLSLGLGTRPIVAAPAAAEARARGDAWALAGRCDEALPYYRKALAAGGDAQLRTRAAQCLLTGPRVDAAAIAEAQRLSDEGLAAGREPALLILAGDLAARRSEWTAAVALYTEAEKRAPRESTLLREARRQRLLALAALGAADEEYRRVAIELAQAIARDPRESAAQRSWADEQWASLRYAEAGRTLLSARRKLAEGDAKAVVALLEPVVAKDASIEEAHYLLGRAYLGLGAGRCKEALAAFQRAPKVKEAVLELGIDALEEGIERAAGQLHAAAALDGNYQPAFYHLGLVEKERGKLAEARVAFQRAAKIDPESALGKQASTKLQLLSGQVRALAEGQVIDAAQEVALGQAIAEKIALRFGEAQDPVLVPRLERILRRLTAVADRPERELRYRVQLVEASIPNAITLPGGTILVFRGLAELVKKELGDSDDAWAAILGHECAHAALRHGVGMMRMASSLTGASAFEGGPGELAQLMNTISRAHEFEADQFGALYAYRAGFSPGTSLALHDAMLRAGGEIPRGMTHPTHAERLAGLRDYLIELRAKVRGFDLATKNLADGDLDAAVVRLEVFLGVFPDSLSARSNLGVALHRKATRDLPASAELRRVTDVDPDSRARKIELRAATKDPPKLDRRALEAAVVEYRAALAVDPSYAPALVNLGAALFDLGDKKGARQILDRAIARAPRAPESWINRATVLADAGALAEAQSDLRRAISIDERSQPAWFDLALVSEKLGRRDEARAAWDRYLALDAKGPWAELARERSNKLK